MSAAARLQGLGGPRKLGEREYTDDDVRKGLRYIQAAVDTGGAAPTGYAVAQLLKLPTLGAPLQNTGLRGAMQDKVASTM